jgi:hypothetical protein
VSRPSGARTTTSGTRRDSVATLGAVAPRVVLPSAPSASLPSVPACRPANASSGVRPRRWPPRSLIPAAPTPLPARRSVVALAAVAFVVLAAALAVAAAPGSGTASSSAPDRSADPVTPATPTPTPDPQDGAPPQPATPPQPPEEAAVEEEADATSGEVARGPLTIQHVGDVLLDREAHPTLGALGAGVWDGARDTFAAADVVVANLECAATTRDDPQAKQFVFRCDLDELPRMRDAGVTAATVANNHSGDHGVLGIVDSLRNVEAAGMTGLGAGRDEAEAFAPRIVEVQGWRVALLGFGGVVPVPEWTSWGDRPGQASGYDAAAMARAVAAADEVADLVVVSIHWGEEGSFEPREEDRERAEAVIAAGADVVFGHHAHRLQPLERVDGVPVFWNLGNFVWPRTSDDAAVTAVGELTVSREGEVTACLVPFEIDHEGRPAPTGEPRDCR